MFRVFKSDINEGNGSPVPEVMEVWDYLNINKGDSEGDGDDLIHVADTILRLEVGPAWDQMLLLDESSEHVSLIVGPGNKAVTLQQPVFHPELFSVWSIEDETTPTFLGFFDQPSTRVVVQRIIDSGDCPIVGSPYLIKVTDWGNERDTEYEPRNPQVFTDPAAIGRIQDIAGLPENQSADDVRRVLTPGGLVVNKTIDDSVAILATNSKDGVRWLAVAPRDEADAWVERCGEDDIEYEFVSLAIHLPNLPSSFDLRKGEFNPDIRLVAHAEVRIAETLEAVQ